MKTHKLHDFFACMIFNCFIVLNTCFVWGQTVTESYNISFDRNDIFIQQEDSFQLLSLKTGYFSYLEDESKPMLPFVNKFILIPQNASLESVSCIVNSTDHYGYVKLPSNPLPVLINSIDSILSIEAKYDDSKTYPNSTIDNYFQHVVDGYKMVGIRLCPFVYNSPTDELRFITNIDVSVQYGVSDTIEPYIYGRILKETVKNMAINGDTLETLYPEISTFSSGSTVDYLIITADSLRSAYKDFVEWKMCKGLITETISIEHIDSVYSGNSKQEKIKRCLYDYYLNKRLKYALLGGDVDIIPTQKCYSENSFSGKLNKRNIPTDYFYSCFDGDFLWNANLNDTIGEINDEAILNPNIIISRLPLNNSVGIQEYSSHLINYERGNAEHYDEILFSGSKIALNFDGKSDAHLIGDTIYNKYIKPYSELKRTFYYDTGNNIENDSISFCLNGFKNVASCGYNIINIDSHGTESSWSFGQFEYRIRDVYTTPYICSSFIITSACLNNNYNTNSLSKWFFKFRKGGIIGYIGNSVEGVTYALEGVLGPSSLINALFYKNVFKHNISKLGEAITASKTYFFLNDCTYFPESEMYKRWNVYSVNPLGDPECDIYTATPSELNNINCYLINNNSYFNTNVDSCSLNILEKSNSSEYDYSIHSKVIGKDFSVPYIGNEDYKYCFFQKGYKPQIITNSNMPNLFIQNSTFNQDFYMLSENVKIGNNVTNEHSAGNVCIPNGVNVSLCVEKGIEIKNGFTCEKGGTLEITVY